MMRLLCIMFLISVLVRAQVDIPQFDLDQNVKEDYVNCPHDGTNGKPDFKTLRKGKRNRLGTELMRQRNYWQSQACYRAALDTWFKSFRFADIQSVRDFSRDQAREEAQRLTDGMAQLAEGRYMDGEYGGVIPGTKDEAISSDSAYEGTQWLRGQ